MFYLPLIFLIAAELPPAHVIDRNALMSAMRKAVAASSDHRDMTIEIVDVSRFPIPDGEVQFEWAGLTPPAAGQSTTRWRGTVRQSADHVFSIWAVVRLTIPCTRIVATQIIRPEEPIAASQVREESYNGFPSESCTQKIGTVIGKVATHTLLANTLIVRAMLAPPASVLKGEQAIAEYHNGAVSLSLPVIAERNGRIGEVIRVLNPETHKTFLAQITGQGQVSIEGASRAVSPTSGDKP